MGGGALPKDVPKDGTPHAGVRNRELGPCRADGRHNMDTLRHGSVVIRTLKRDDGKRRVAMRFQPGVHPDFFVLWIESSRSCLKSASDGEPVISSTPRLFFGKAMTSRILSAFAISMTRRSRPSAIPPWGGAPNWKARSM